MGKDKSGIFWYWYYKNCEKKNKQTKQLQYKSNILKHNIEDNKIKEKIVQTILSSFVIYLLYLIILSNLTS